MKMTEAFKNATVQQVEALREEINKTHKAKRKINFKRR